MFEFLSHIITSTSLWGAEAAVLHPDPFCLMAVVATVACVMLAVEQIRERDFVEATAFGAFGLTTVVAAYLAYNGRTDQLASWFSTAAWGALLACAAWIVWVTPQAFAGAKDGRNDRRSVTT